MAEPLAHTLYSAWHLIVFIATVTHIFLKLPHPNDAQSELRGLKLLFMNTVLLWVT